MDLSEHVTFDSERAIFKYTPLVIKTFLLNKVFVVLSHKSYWTAESTLTVGKDVVLEPYCSVETPKEMFSIGAFSYSSSQLPAGTKVGRYCLFGPDIEIIGPRHTLEWATSSSLASHTPHANTPFPLLAAHNDFNEGLWLAPYYPLRDEMPIIGNDVWIGQGALLARNIKIGTGSVIAARTVVTKDVSPYSIVAGNPGRIKRQRFDDKTAERLLASGWWNYDVSIFRNCDVTDPNRFLDNLENWKAKSNPQPYLPDKIGFMDLVRMVAEAKE